MKCKDCPKFRDCSKQHDLRKYRPYCSIARDEAPPEPKETKGECSLFYCDHVGERRCCRHCQRYDRCPNKCLNHPTRCGALVDKAVGKPKGVVKSLS